MKFNIRIIFKSLIIIIAAVSSIKIKKKFLPITASKVAEAVKKKNTIDMLNKNNIISSMAEINSGRYKFIPQDTKFYTEEEKKAARERDNALTQKIVSQQPVFEEEKSCKNQKKFTGNNFYYGPDPKYYSSLTSNQVSVPVIMKDLWMITPNERNYHKLIITLKKLEQTLPKTDEFFGPSKKNTDTEKKFVLDKIKTMGYHLNKSEDVINQDIMMNN